MQADLKSRVEEAATANKRSMNTEIVRRLEASFSEWPRVVLPEELAARVASGSPEYRRLAEEDVQRMALHVLERLYPPEGPKVSPEEFYRAGYAALPKMADKDRERLLDDLLSLTRKIANDPGWQPPEYPDVSF
jgi:hypothetical protein